MSAAEIKAWLEAQTWPLAVPSWDVVVGHDATDDPAVWVWMDVPFETTTSEDRVALREAVFRRLLERETGFWPYVRFGRYETVEAR